MLRSNKTIRRNVHAHNARRVSRDPVRGKRQADEDKFHLILNSFNFVSQNIVCYLEKKVESSMHGFPSKLILRSHFLMKLFSTEMHFKKVYLCQNITVDAQTCFEISSEKECILSIILLFRN